jgi:hypothetical protein
MFVQWCLKGLPRREAAGGDPAFDDAAAQDVLNRRGLSSNWLRRNLGLAQDDAARKRRDVLTARAVYDHVNNYGTAGPTTPYISLSAGCVERDKYLATNVSHPALATALDFATDWGRTEGYVFWCWVPLSLNPAPTVECVAEEVRELNTYMRYSAYQTEGEVSAKIHVPANQIQACVKYDAGLSVVASWTNASFDAPEALANIRTCI